jgi:molecular chaperone DnaK
MKFLWYVGEAVVAQGMRGLMSLLPFGDLIYDISADVWGRYQAARREQQLLEDLQEVLQADPAITQTEARQIARQVAAGQPEEEILKLEAYLTQVPGVARQSLRRPQDPSGKTVPATLNLQDPLQLAALLPGRPPRFKIGDAVPHAPQWRFVELLGSGGFGEVWLARHTFLDEHQAFKFCLDPAGRDRLLRHEGEIVKRVMAESRRMKGTDDGIVPLLDAYLEGDTPWLAYEYINGGDLAGLIRQMAHAAPAERGARALKVLRGLAKIVGRFHRLPRPIIHRDLKPANILLKKDGTRWLLRITDFGISHVAADRNLRQAITSTPNLKLGESLRGAHTPLYASPQQKRGMKADVRDDVHALGMIGYQLLLADLGAERPAGKWRKRVAECGLSDKILDVLENCWDDDPNERPTDALALAEALVPIPPAAGAPTPSPTPTATNPEGYVKKEPLTGQAGTIRNQTIIGIDLGTTNSVAAVMEGSTVKVIANENGDVLMPSVVAFTDKDDPLVGDPARRQAVTNPRRTISSIKRFMGQRRKEVCNQERLVPYKIVGGPNEPARVEIDGRTYTPAEISSIILRKLKESAEAYLQQRVSMAVITVPAYFNDYQRQVTLEAAALAGFDTDWEFDDPLTGMKTRQRMRIINEPTAASLAYGLDKKKDEKIAVVAMGGGSLDISILEVGDGVFVVEATNGDTHLGGDDFDQVLIDYLADEFMKEHGNDLRKHPMALQRLKEAAEQAKKDLSQASSTDVTLPFALGANHLAITIKRSQFEKMVDHLIERCRKPVLQALSDAKMKPSNIDEIVMVGGMTRMPRMQWLVKDIFGKDGHRGVNPDEVVAIGAAIQGAQLLLGSKSDVLLVDVTPLSLGIETMGGRLTCLIERNTKIPTEKSHIFSTTSDNQPAVTISVYQGESEIAKSSSNRLLGEFNLEGIRRAPRGEPEGEGQGQGHR